MATLTTIAHDMEQQAKRRGVAHRELARGLAMELVIVGGQKVLTLSRPAVKPAEQEIAICRGAFNVPEGAGRLDSDYSVTLRWPSDQ